LDVNNIPSYSVRIAFNLFDPISQLVFNFPCRLYIQIMDAFRIKTKSISGCVNKVLLATFRRKKKYMCHVLNVSLSVRPGIYIFVLKISIFWVKKNVFYLSKYLISHEFDTISIGFFFIIIEARRPYKKSVSSIRWW